MNELINQDSLKKSGCKLIYGKAYNSRGKHKAKLFGKSTPEYIKWYSMINRCYSEVFHLRQPTYKDCEVCDEWLDFQNFAQWFHQHPDSKKGYQLDKDLLVPSNKVYSPDTCCFVPRNLNNLLLDSKKIRGEFPQGVCFEKKEKKFRATLKISGKCNFLGYFDCSDKAHQAYVVAKEAYVKEVANKWRGRIDERVYEALMRWTVA